MIITAVLRRRGSGSRSIPINPKAHTAVQHCAAQVKALSGKAVKCRQRLVKQCRGRRIGVSDIQGRW